MVHALIGQKKMQTQRFLVNGTRIPVTEVTLSPNSVISLKTQEKDGYAAVQLGIGHKKHPTKQLIGHIKGARSAGSGQAIDAPQFLREVRSVDELLSVGDIIKAGDVFKPGDLIDVIGISKGKGYAGGVKRYGFKGGPRTHGQSDRERAPGSIGQATTPGRVYKGKRMAGRMGSDRVTVKNLEIVAVLDDAVWIKGLVPGGKNNLLYIKKIGEVKKFVPLLQASEEIKTEDQVEEVVQTPESVIETSKEVKEDKENAI